MATFSEHDMLFQLYSSRQIGCNLISQDVVVDVYDGDDDDDDPPRAWTSKTCIPLLLCYNMQQKDDDYNASTHSQRSRTMSSFD